MNLIGRRYELLHEIGEGGMGKVYRAYDRLTREMVALKRVTVSQERLMFTSRRSFGSTLDLRLALAQEFRTLASLRHPHIISVLEYGFDGENRYPYYTMELLENAQTILEAGKELSTNRRINLLIQVVQALEYLHRRGIIHRDLKPDNILVVNGIAKVLDFGLAVVRSMEEDTGEHVVGTLAYMAPEVLQGQPAHESADLYAIGMIAYELLSGQYPYSTDNVNDMIADIMHKVPDVYKAEVEPGLHPILRRLLAKDPEERYPNAPALIQDYAAVTGQTTVLESRLIRESFLQAARFVGRDHEFKILSQALSRAMDKQGSVWLIGGESGVGKSRLIEEVRTQALVQGALVLRGQTVAEGGAPYGLWRDVMQHLCLHVELNDLEASVVKGLVPDISKLIGREVADAPDLDSKSMQSRLLNVMEAIIRRLDQPTVILLEDLHWAKESLQVLSHFVSLIKEFPILIVGNYRDDERPSLPDELPGVQVMQLKRLTSEAISDLSASILGDDIGRQPHVVDLLKRETEGNIFFIVEVVRALAEDAGQLNRVGQVTLPSRVFAQGIKTVIQRRLSHLPDLAIPILETAAVAGRYLDLAIMRLIVGGEDALNNWLNICDNAAVIEVSENRWRFSHDKLRETMLDGLSEEKRIDLHQRVAQAIERVYPDDPSKFALLAYHWAETKNKPKEAHYATQAGIQSLKNSAYREAIGFLERALRLTDQAGVSWLEQAHLSYYLGEAYYSSGEMEKAQQQLNNALQLLGYPLPSSARAGIEILRQLSHRLGLKRQKQIPENQLFIIHAYERLAQTSYLSSDKLGAIYYVFGGLNLSENAGSMALAEQGRFYGSVCLAFGLAPFHAGARLYRNRADETAHKLSDINAIAWLKETTGVYAAGRGQWQEAKQRFEECLKYAEQVGNQRIVDEARENLIGIEFFQGNWRQAHEMREALYAASVRRGDRQLMTWTMLGKAELALRYGHLDEAFTYIGEGEITAPDDTSHTIVNSLYCMYFMRQNDLATAQLHTTHIRSAVKGVSPTLYSLLNTYRSIIECDLTLWEKEHTPAHRANALESIDLLNQYSKVFDIGKPSLYTYMAWCAGLEGNASKLTKYGTQAIQEAKRLNMIYEQSLAHYHLARFLQGWTNERRQHIQQAQKLFESLGASYELQLLDALIEPI